MPPTTLAYTDSKDVHEHKDYDEYSYEYLDNGNDNHHRSLLVHCFAILPLLALMILLPNTCYSILRRRADRQRKMD